ncbi:MAG: hypothetical protein H7251_09990 [Acetobacteraceae bacterium]|nr:hypothetical protein [Acetobacteraceae bacterium]
MRPIPLLRTMAISPFVMLGGPLHHLDRCIVLRLDRQADGDPGCNTGCRFATGGFTA